MAKKTFEQNGGYYINGVPYMDCRVTGEPVRNVSTDAVSVMGSRAINGQLHKLFPDTSKPSYKPTGRPAGWHFMNEFVDGDGNVFHKGVEQPDLKGTLPPTKVKPVKKKKTKRRSKEEILLARHEKKKKVLKKAKKKLNDKIKRK